MIFDRAVHNVKHSTSKALNRLKMLFITVLLEHRQHNIDHIRKATIDA